MSLVERFQISVRIDGQHHLVHFHLGRFAQRQVFQLNLHTIPLSTLLPCVLQELYDHKRGDLEEVIGLSWTVFQDRQKVYESSLVPTTAKTASSHETDELRRKFYSNIEQDHGFRTASGLTSFLTISSQSLHTTSRASLSFSRQYMSVEECEMTAHGRRVFFLFPDGRIGPVPTRTFIDQLIQRQALSLSRAFARLP